MTNRSRHRAPRDVPSALENRLRDVTIQFGFSSYNEGRGLVATLESTFQAAQTCGIQTPSFILSDSSDSSDTVSAAEAWSSGYTVSLLVDRSERRRSKKEAVNTIFDRADADLLILVDADMLVVAEGLAALLMDLTSVPRPEVALGAVAPEPSKRAIKYRAASWQLHAVLRLNSRLPADAARAEGAFWGAWRSFYEHYRYPIGSGSIYDDIELARHLQDNHIPVRNSWRAVAYKVPAASLRDFYLQTYRYYAAAGASPRPSRDLLRAAAAEALRDPLGAIAYAYARSWAAFRHRRRPVEFEEYWDAAASTKR